MSSKNISDLYEWQQLTKNLDTFFLIIMGCVIYFMQCGFAFLECGAVRNNNTTNILLKNVLDAFVGGLAYWLFGFALAYGETGNKFIGYEFWALSDCPDDKYASWFFQYVFAATAATIVSGALAERCDFVAYLIYSFVISGFIYPIGSHWTWSPDGWLAKGFEFHDNGGGDDVVAVQIKYHDFAGSGVVHLVGGTISLVAAIIIGPRIGRFDTITGKAKPIRGHSVPLTALGGFVLFFGFLAFNAGSQLSISKKGDGEIIALVVVNTIISASAAALTTLLVKRCVDTFYRQDDGGGGGGGKWSLITTVNGALSGMVAICAGCNAVRPWCAFLIGMGAANFSYFCSLLAVRLKIDDPLDAIAVHGSSGLWGILAVPIFESDIGFIYTASRLSCMKFLWQLAAATSYMAWSGGLGMILFGLLRFTKLLRVSEHIERCGLDIIKHDEPAYPRGRIVYATDLKQFVVKDEANLEYIEREIIRRQSSLKVPVPKREEIRNGGQNGGRNNEDNISMKVEGIDNEVAVNVMEEEKTVC